MAFKALHPAKNNIAGSVYLCIEKLWSLPIYPTFVLPTTVEFNGSPSCFTKSKLNF